MTPFEIEDRFLAKCSSASSGVLNTMEYMSNAATTVPVLPLPPIQCTTATLSAPSSDFPKQHFYQDLRPNSCLWKVQF
jgi:hypothetical protein